jgi:hypothetical protein
MKTLKNNKGKLLVGALLILVLVMASLVPAASADEPIRAYICITGSDNSQLTPGISHYKLGSILYFGQGTESGCLYHDFPAGTTNVEVWTTYNSTSSQHLTQNISVNPTFNFYTNKLTLKLTKCDSTPLSGGTARMRIGSTTYFFAAPNATGSDGKTSAEVFPGTYDFEMNYNSTAEWKYGEVIPNSDHELSWKTTLVNLAWPGQISYGGSTGDFRWFNKPAMELMPGTVKFHFRGGPTLDLIFTSCSFSGGFLTLIDEAGKPLANYPADYPTETRNLKWKYRCGGSWGPTTSFQTDANGQTFYSVGCSNWDKKITMTLNQTSLEQNVTVNSVFQAARANANLKSCTVPITDVPGGSVDQGGGFWYRHGDTGPTGTVIFYTFPANIKLRMSYNHNSQTVYPTIVAGSNEVDFLTTKLTINYAGDIKSNKGGSWWMFIKPSMYLLPGDYNFWFKTGSTWYGPVAVSVSGCEMTKALLRLLDENGNGVVGGKAIPAFGGSWGDTLPGQTDANGNLFTDIPPGFTKIKMTVNQGAEEQTLAQLTASNYTWTTEILRIGLNDHDGYAIADEQAVLKQGGGYWYTWGNLNASGYRDIQLFPRTTAYKFQMEYNYTSDTQYPVVGVTAGIDNFYFQTGQVFGSCITQYSAGAWRAFTDGMELMPGVYTFQPPSQLGTVTAGAVTNLSCP